MTPAEIDAAATLLRTFAQIVGEIEIAFDDPRSRDRKAIVHVWLETLAGRLEIDKLFLDHLPDAPEATFVSLQEWLTIRLAQLREAEEGGQS